MGSNIILDRIEPGYSTNSKIEIHLSNGVANPYPQKRGKRDLSPVIHIKTFNNMAYGCYEEKTQVVRTVRHIRTNLKS
jgi:hypothetical protein